MSNLVLRTLARLGSAHHRPIVISSAAISSTKFLADSNPHLTVKQVLDNVTQQLSAAEVPEPDLSAKYLLSSCISPDSTKPVLANDWTKCTDQNLTPGQLSRLHKLVQCRLARMPVQYILGNWDFHSITVQVRPPVFIPRPETEQMVDLVLASLPPPEHDKTLHLLEIGPGTGAVSLALLTARQDLKVTCIERSLAAIELTKDNARMLNMSDRLEVVHGKVESGKQVEGLVDQYNLVFSNPPYILRKDLMSLAPEIYLYEDLRALDGGAEGLDVILPILELAAGKLVSGGLVILEVDPCHSLILPGKLTSLGINFEVDKVVEDFMKKERFLVLRKF